jgi:hypothetical protein
MERESHGRDRRMREARKVRDGEIQDLWPDHFSERYPQSIVANFIDGVARDLSEVIAPLPALSCSAGQMKTEADKRRASRKQRIGEYYHRVSQLETQMYWGADQYLTYGFVAARLEPDLDNRCPKIRVDDPTHTYYIMDRDFHVAQYAKSWREDVHNLAARFPDAKGLILYPEGKPCQETELKVICYIDGTNYTLYLPERRGVILLTYEHKLSRTPVEIAVRPGLHTNPRGQFDDVLWVQLARAVMAQLTLEAGHKAVEAPITVPSDVVELNVGPDAVIQTDNPQGVGRVHLQVPGEAFALGQQLEQELKTGSRYPDMRMGQADASVITGKGVQALMGGFDTQIKTAQQFLGRMVRDITELAFEMDEKWWPNKVETINGSYSGESYQVTYTPSVDIAGNYTCDVTYGFAAGMSPQNALVMMLQARGDGLVDRDTVRRQLRSMWGIDIEQAQRDLDVQELNDGVKQGILAALQSSGQMLAQGMTDQAMLFFNIADQMIRGRQNGKPLNDILMSALADYQQQQQAQQQAAMEAQAAAAGGAAGPGQPSIEGVGPDGLPAGVAPGQAGLPPGGMPAIQSLVAGMTNGTPSIGATVRKRLPVG